MDYPSGYGLVRVAGRTGAGRERTRFSVLLPGALVALAVLARPAQAQAGAAPAQPTCRLTLDSLDAKVRQNYAGFLLEVRDARRRDYEAMLGRTAARADRTALDQCYPVLAAYIEWYADPHLFVFQSQSTDTLEARGRAAGLRRLTLTEDGVRAAITRHPRGRDPLEGIWYDGRLRIAVVPDPAGRRGDLLGVVVASDTVAWPVGAVRATFRRTGDGVYATTLLTREFAEMRLTARIHKHVLLRLSPGMWGRAFPVSPADTGLIDPEEVHRPRVSLRARSVLFSLPSHDPQYAGLLDSLVAAHAADIAARPLLIIDLRGNEGGSSLMSRALDPYLVSAERRATPFDSGTAVMLSSPAQIKYARRLLGNDTSAFGRNLLAQLESHPGELVSIEEAGAPPPPPDSVIAGGWRVAVLTDGGTVSAAEVMVLQALRSTRAVVVGQPTAGALDYQSVQIVSLGTGGHRWGLGYPTITAHADLPRRGMRGKGISTELRMDWDRVSDPIGEVERRLAP